jgi:hypothetical protein
MNSKYFLLYYIRSKSKMSDNEETAEEKAKRLEREAALLGRKKKDNNLGGSGSLNDTLEKANEIIKASKDAYTPRKKDVSRNLNISRNARKRLLQDKALTNPTEFYQLRDNEFIQMEAVVIEVYEMIFQKYIQKQYSEEDAEDHAEKVAKSLMGVLTNIIEEDYGGTAGKAAVSRKALQSAADTIGKGGMQV